MRTHSEQQKMKNPPVLKIKKKQIKPLQVFENSSSPFSTKLNTPILLLLVVGVHHVIDGFHLICQ